MLVFAIITRDLLVITEITLNTSLSNSIEHALSPEHRLRT